MASLEKDIMECMLEELQEGLKSDRESTKVFIAMTKYVEARKRRRHQYWVQPILQRRSELGAFHTLVQEFIEQNEGFRGYFRLTVPQYEFVLRRISPSLKRLSLTREAISPDERLAIFLRYAAAGESQQSIAWQYRVGATTVHRIVNEVAIAINDHLCEELVTPTTPMEWQLVAENYQENWQYPNCVGAIDGKHINMFCAANSGSNFFNYKGQFSIVLMAVVDANYKFIYVDVGKEGKNSDGGIFQRVAFGRALNDGALNLPSPRTLPGGEDIGPLPYVFVADEAFPLLPNVMRPYPGKGIVENQRIFNTRLSMARRMVESTFGILAVRWRIFHTKIYLNPTTLAKVVKACCILHNLIQSSSTPAKIKVVRKAAKEDGSAKAFRDLPRTAHRMRQDGVEVRNQYMDYFVNVAPLHWQEKHVRQGTQPTQTPQ